MKNFINWLVTSSADPKKLSLFVGGSLTVIAAQALSLATTLCGLGLYCVGIDSEQVNQAIMLIEQIVFWSASIVGSLAALLGLVRKWNLGRWSAATPDAE